MTLIAPVSFNIDRVAAQNSAAATAVPDALPFATGFLVTGNYVVAGVDLPKAGGLGTINFNEPALAGGADIVGAYLYWETITRATLPLTAVSFRGQPISGAKASTINVLPGLPAASCWGSAGGSTSKLTMFRADVLGLLEKQLDVDGRWTGKYLVNNTDLVASGKSLNTVMLPQQGTGNVLTQSAGASLVLVYKALTEPLRKVVVYDGAYAQPQGTTMSQTIKAFYKSATSKSARLTHIIGSGSGNTGERLLFNGQAIATNPVPAPIDSGADRGWSNPTVDVTAQMPGSDSNDGFGETVTTGVDHGARNQNTTPYECLSWAATIFEHLGRRHRQRRLT